MSVSITGYYNSPIGTIIVEMTDGGISSLIFSDKPVKINSDDLFLQDTFRQLDEYFAGKRQFFDLPLTIKGTAFQMEVWDLLLKIPFGKTLSYLDISNRLGNSKKIRAVGRANAKNPISIIIPCHRVVGHDGNLTGYAGGLWRKEWLLDHEKTYKQLSLFKPERK
ncbi:MAG: methylated-DNA--[protein]-cysteine S-methyltransferase [Bacteroidales bacterium]|nr:methylated-DNA--[protein]-cysteine S-methyltransferase [Bacteroidales bacterium]MCF8403317.1 methylated-DNA--[protein]-cysteine S-methyltransferase [Bacteroidales bacterium]